MKKERQIETVSVCFPNFKTKHTNFDYFMKVRQIFFPQINKKTDKKTSQTMKKERQIETVSVCFPNFKTKHTNFDYFMKVALLHILKLT